MYTITISAEFIFILCFAVGICFGWFFCSLANRKYDDEVITGGYQPRNLAGVERKRPPKFRADELPPPPPKPKHPKR